jgi:hypothetical protein
LPFPRARWALFLATGAALPFYAFPPVSLAGRRVDLATLAAAGFVALTALALLLAQRPVPRKIGALALGFVIVPLLALAPPRSSSFAPHEFWISYSHWLLVTAFFLGALLREDGGPSRSTLVNLSFAVALAVSAFGLYQMVGHPHGWIGTGDRLLAIQRQPFGFAIFGNYGEYLRPTSVFLEPAWLGGYLAWVFALAVSETAAPRSDGASRFLARAVLVVCGATMVATLSLGTYADLLAAGAVLLVGIVRNRSLRLPWRWLAATAAVLVLFVVLTPLGTIFRNAISQRIDFLVATSRASRSSSGAAPAVPDSSWVRVRNVEETLRKFREHPVRGIGLGQFFGSFSQAKRDPSLVPEPWCGWVTIAAQMGLLGPLLLVGAFAAVLGRASRASGGGRTVAVGALLAIAAVQQLHTASFIDLWWWYPMSVAAVLAAAPISPPEIREIK